MRIGEREDSRLIIQRIPQWARQQEKASRRRRKEQEKERMKDQETNQFVPTT